MQHTSYITFKEAVVSAYHILKQTTNKPSSWFGKKVFLGYSEERGWKVYQLSFFAQILRRLELAYLDTHQQLIVKQLATLNAEEARFIQVGHLASKMPTLKEKLKEKLKEIYDSKFQTPQKSKHLLTPSKILFSRSEEKQTGGSERAGSTTHKQTHKEAPREAPGETPKPKLELKKEELHQEETSFESSTLKSVSLKQSEEAQALLPPEGTKELQQRQKKQICQFPPVKTPLFLRNYKSSRCYLDSVLEMMLAQNTVRAKIFERCADKNISIEEKEVLEKLRELIVIVHETKGKAEGDRSPIGKNSPAERVREAIFASQLNSELSNSKHIYKQQDASCVLLLFNTLLENGFETVEVDTAISKDLKAEKLVEKRPVAMNYTLELAFKENIHIHDEIQAINEELVSVLNRKTYTNRYRDNLISQLIPLLHQIRIEKTTKFSSLIDQLEALKKSEEINLKQICTQLAHLNTSLMSNLTGMLADFFKSKQAVASSGEKEKRDFALKNGTEAKFHFISKTELKTLSDSLCLHIKRYECSEGRERKLKNSVTLPSDAVVDMTPYYSGDKSQVYQYEITGYVIHHGDSLHSGHYTANVKIGDKFYSCDDGNSSFHQEISSDEFYANTDAYLIMLKRIPNSVSS